MNIVQTFWSGPTVTDRQTVLSNRGGWLSCEYNWMSWALSCLQAKDVFGAVNLVTDDIGKEILINKLQLPYATVSTPLQGILDQYPASLWALAKIYTYSIQTGPFLHLDGDLYLWQKPSPDVLNGQLIAQNLDKNLPFYAEILNIVHDNFSFIPDVISRNRFENEDLYASNAGILGGSNLPFFKEYCRQAFEFVNKNKSALSKVKGGGLNFIFEQYLFCRLASEYNIPVTYYKGVVDNPVFKDFIRFEDYPNVQMVHPVGGFKQYPHVCDHLAKKLRRDYPEYYYRVINLLQDAGVKIRSAIYTLPDLDIDALPGLQARSKKSITNHQSFLRTQAVIDYLNKNYFAAQEVTVDKNVTRTEINEQVLSRLDKAIDKKRLLEIYTLETKHNSLLKATYKDAISINKLYKSGVDAYEQIQDTFSKPIDQLSQITVSVQPGYLQSKAGWDWKYDYIKDIPTIIERNFNLKRVPQNVILLPDILQAGIKEYYPDDLDLILFETLKTPLKLCELLTEMKQYFSDEDINDSIAKFENLIISTVKRLLYFGLLKINLE
ncbi:DUF6734 family protein [Mucilaginibacter litoreus]|uniref:DUF6734 family protein n=1 Tax=Mucilaginibacter litoreus TaxID=1048221 RepID=A0ABW3AWJ5_9SPHI